MSDEFKIGTRVLCGDDDVAGIVIDHWMNNEEGCVVQYDNGEIGFEYYNNLTEEK